MAALTGLATLALVAPAGAEIVYTHGDGVGSVLMAMNDDGSGAHVLLSASQVPPNDQLEYPSLSPAGSTLVFQGITDEYDNLNGPPGDSGANYGGLYTLAGGVVTRISAPPAPVANAGSEDTSPAQTSDGRVVYENLALTYYSDGSVSGSSDQLLVRPLSGGTPSTWTTAPQTSLGRVAADPANGGLIAYTAGSPSQLAIGDHNGTTTIVANQPEGFNPAFSPDGSQLVDVDWTPASSTGTGFSAGIWVFPSQAGATGREVLVDPNDPAANFHRGTFNDPIFVGNGQILFEATVSGAKNLYEVPASCNQCSFPGPDVKQLTSDGTTSAPDYWPAWTSQTITELGQGGGGSGGGGGTGTGGTGGTGGGGGGGGRIDQVRALGLVAHSVRVGRPLILRLTLRTRTRVTIHLLRWARASGHGNHRRRAHYAPAGTVRLTANAGRSRLRISRVHGHRLGPGRYELKLSAGGRAHTVSFTVHR